MGLFGREHSPSCWRFGELRGKNLPAMPGFAVVTFGCQMNQHDSDRISEVLACAGWTAEPDPERADLVLLNTCSVREKAEQKLRSEVGRIALIKAAPARALDRDRRLRRARGGRTAAEPHARCRSPDRSRQHRGAAGTLGRSRARRARASAHRVRRGSPALPRRTPAARTGQAERVRHGDEGLQRALCVLHRAAHARTRALPAGG